MTINPVWPFIPQPNKPSYNEGDHIAPYNNPVWSMEEGSNIPITPTHKPCGYWTKDYVPPPTNLPPDGLIAWYPVDEGIGTVITNIVSPNVNRLPNLAVVAAGSAFWTQSSGFGYWDGAATLVNAAWVAKFPFPTKAGTIILFAKEAYGLNDGSTHHLFCLIQPMYAHNVYRVGAYGLQFNYGWGSTASDNYQLKIPIADYYARPFVAAYTHDTVQTSIQRIKYQGQGWVSDTNATVPSGYNHANGVSSLYFGQYTDGTNKWKGLLGDLMIWNVQLTDAQVESIMTTGFTLNGKTFSASRWGL